MTDISNSIRIDATTLAVLDATDYYGQGMMITRVFVPLWTRGKGHGRTLLKHACDVADKTNTKLFLEISPYIDSPLDYYDLRRWYQRYGFNGPVCGIMRRLPR